MAISPEQRIAICTAIRHGIPAKHACAREGVPVRTYNDWLKRGREGQEPHATFLDEIERAKAECLGVAAENVYRAGSQDWRAALALLERRDPEHWGKKERVEHSGTTTQVQVQGKSLGKDVTRRLRAQVLGLSEQELEDKERLGKDWGLD